MATTVYNSVGLIHNESLTQIAVCVRLFISHILKILSK